MQYLCGTENRRRMVRGKTGKDYINGIDYLEVVDSQELAHNMRQRRLLLFFLNPLTKKLDRDNIRIEGGEPSHQITVTNIVEGIDGDIEKIWKTSLIEEATVLTLSVERPGDFSTYNLRLIDRGNPYDPPPNFDPLLSEIKFSFKVACPTDMDCQPLPFEAHPFQTQPPIDYLAKDYASFRRLMLDRMAVVMPDWGERSPADLGIALIEVLAYAADHLSYYQDATATEAYLGTARKRVSVRRHARLLDYSMHDGCNSRVWVCLEVGQDGDGVTLLSKTPLLTRITRAPTVFLLKKAISQQYAADQERPVEIVMEPVPQEKIPSEEQKEVKTQMKDHPRSKGKKSGRKKKSEPKNPSNGFNPSDPTPPGWEDPPPPGTRGGTGPVLEEDWEAQVKKGTEIFETLHEIDLFTQHNKILFYTWGEKQCYLPKGATQATLKGKLRNLKPGNVLIFEENICPLTGLEADADPLRKHPVRLTEVSSPQTDHLNGEKVVDVKWHVEDALPFPLQISALVEHEGGKRVVHDISIARGNVVLADHGRSIREEELLPPLVPGEGPYRTRLQRTGITQRVLYDHDLAQGRSAIEAVMQDPRSALPVVTLQESNGGEEWNPQRELLNSGRFAHEFVVEPEDDGRAHLRFGNNVLGRKPIPGAFMRATYRIGNGSAGNVGAGAIAHVVTNLPGIQRVDNPLPATGGTSSESIEQVRLYAPKAFRTKKRAVTESDYAEITQQHPEVQKAVAQLRWTGSWHTMFLTVDRKGGHPVDDAFEEELRGFMEPYRQTGRDLEFSGPRFVPLEIAFTIHVADGHLCNSVKTALLFLFSDTDLPEGRRGIFHPDNFTFSQPVYLSPLIASAMSVVGVEWVDNDPTPPKPNRFRRLGESSNEALEAGIITIGRLEIVRLDNDPNAPENGIIGFHMEGGL